MSLVLIFVSTERLQTLCQLCTSSLSLPYTIFYVLKRNKKKPFVSVDFAYELNFLYMSRVVYESVSVQSDRKYLRGNSN